MLFPPDLVQTTNKTYFMTAEKEFIKKHFDSKHPLLFQLRSAHGLTMEEVEEIMKSYAKHILDQNQLNKEVTQKDLEKSS